MVRKSLVRRGLSQHCCELQEVNVDKYPFKVAKCHTPMIIPSLSWRAAGGAPAVGEMSSRAPRPTHFQACALVPPPLPPAFLGTPACTSARRAYSQPASLQSSALWRPSWNVCAPPADSSLHLNCWGRPLGPPFGRGPPRQVSKWSGKGIDMTWRKVWVSKIKKKKKERNQTELEAR